MRRNMNEDEFLYDVSEESILKDWNMGTEAPDHEFSEKYKEFRQELIYRAEKGQSGSDCRETEENRMDTADIIPMKPKRKRFFKTPVGVAAAFAVVIALSVGAYAISGIFTVKDRKREDDNGGIEYTFEVQEGIAVTPALIQLGYVPEGYVEYGNGGNGTTLHKLHKADGSGGLTVGISDYSYRVDFSFVSSYEETEIGGIKADILNREGDIDYSHIILIFYEDLGQLVTIYGHRDIPLDELEKVAENIQLEPTGEAPYVPEVKAEAEKGEEPPAVQAQIVREDQKIGWNEPIDVSDGMTFTVKNIELKDNINGLDENYLVETKDDYAMYLNEDGTFKDVELGYTAWENNTMVKKSQGTGYVKMAYVTMDVANTTDTDLTDAFVYGTLGRIGTDDNSGYLIGSDVLEGWWVPASGEPFYYDGSDYTDSTNDNKHLFFSDLKAGETRTVHLAFAYVEQMEEEAFLMFENRGEDKEPLYVKLVP